MAMSKAKANDVLRREAKKIYNRDAALTRKGTTAEYPALARDFVTVLIEIMKLDPLFGFFCKDVFGTGSYHQKMRVKKPTEFDYDVELNFPVHIVHEEPGFAGLRFDFHRLLQRSMNSGHLIAKVMVELGLVKLANAYNFLVDPKAVRNWFTDLCRNALAILGLDRLNPRLISVEVTQHGPATTIKLKIRKPPCVNIDIDLVPVVCFEGKNGEHALHLCPKYDDCWRKTYVGEEKKQFEDSGVARQVVKLLKLFRDCQGKVWQKVLASYFLKTVVLHMLADGRMRWNQKCLGQRFLDALKELEQYLLYGNIPMFADPEENLLSNVPSATVKDVHNRLRMIIGKIERNPQKLSEYFKQKDRKRSNAFQGQGQSTKRCRR